MDLEQIILEEIAKNKSKYGQAKSSAVFGMVMKRVKDSISKEEIHSIKKKVEDLTEKVNKGEIKVDDMVAEEEKKEKINPYSIEDLLKKLKELPNAKEGKVVTRMEPSPSGPLHLGHIFTLLINYWYAKKYNGKFILRIADTNPRNILPESYGMIVEDAEWLIGERIEEVITQSERIETYYEVAEYLIKDGFAYVCKCSPEKFKQYISKGKACPHRDQSIETNLHLWEKMKKGECEEGECVLRINNKFPF